MRHNNLLEIKSLVKSRHVDLLRPVDWQIPEQVESRDYFEDQIPRQVEAGPPPRTLRLELGIPKVSSADQCWVGFSSVQSLSHV